MAQNSVHIDGDKVKAERETRFLTQAELAKRVNITINTLSLIESDPDYRTSFKTIRALAMEFGCAPGDLVPVVEAAS